MKVFGSVLTAACLCIGIGLVFHIIAVRDHMTRLEEKVAAADAGPSVDVDRVADLEARLTRLESAVAAQRVSNDTPDAAAGGESAELQSKLTAQAEELAALREDVEALKQVRDRFDESANRLMSAFGADSEDAGGGMGRLSEAISLFRRRQEDLTPEEQARREEITAGFRQRMINRVVDGFDRGLETKLTDEQKTKVQAAVEKLTEGMREQYSALREIEDRAKRTAKMRELSDELDGKLREQLRGVVEREQMRRLYQIRLQVRPVVESLANERIAGRLELTEDQKKKLDEISKEMEAKQTELFSAMRNADQDQRGQFFQKMRQLRTDTDEKSLGVLTDEQKKSFEEMKGKKIELQMRRGRRQTT